MIREAVRVDAGRVARSTYLSNSMIEEHLKSAQKLEADAEGEARKLKGLCKCCHYLRAGALAGQAFTFQPCGLCGVEQTYGNTNTDVLCLPCSTKNHLCKHCGADLELETTRKFEPIT